MYTKLTYLVGHARGGTTWFGELVSLHPDVAYIFEPFASQAHPYTGYNTQSLLNNHYRYLPQKKGQYRVDFMSDTFFNLSGDNPQLTPYETVPQSHIQRLAEIYFPDQQDYHLVLKQPRLENLGWVMAHLKPQYVVMIDRHPFGVVNSIRRGEYWQWVRYDWENLEQSITQTHPEYSHLVEGVTSTLMKYMVISYIRSKVMRAYCEDKNILVIDYEALCLDTLGQMQQVAEYLNLSWHETFIAAIEQNVRDAEGGTRHMLDTRRDPHKRAYGWRRELSFELLDEFIAFIEKHNLDIAYPGKGLDELSSEEREANIAYNRDLQRKQRMKNIRTQIKRIGAKLLG